MVTFSSFSFVCLLLTGSLDFISPLSLPILLIWVFDYPWGCAFSLRFIHACSELHGFSLLTAFSVWLVLVYPRPRCISLGYISEICLSNVSMHSERCFSCDSHATNLFFCSTAIWWDTRNCFYCFIFGDICFVLPETSSISEKVPWAAKRMCMLWMLEGVTCEYLLNEFNPLCRYILSFIDF